MFDSQTPGLLQLGTVWLPLPHLLMIPFILSNAMWQSGTGGSIPSMIAYVLGVMGIFRLVRGVLEADAPHETGGRQWAHAAAAFAYGANPNLIYMQATAMTESALSGAVYLGRGVLRGIYSASVSRRHEPA